MQSSRDQEANSLQSSREQTAKSMQSSAQQYARPYYGGGAAYPAWDAGAGMAAAATGAAVGTAVDVAAGSAMAPHPAAGAQYATAQPCSAPVSVSVGGANYVKCGSIWYTQAYGPSGPEFVQVQAPPGVQ